MAGRPLLRGFFFFAELAGGLALGTKGSAMRIDHLSLVAGGPERTARSGLVGRLAQTGLARLLLQLRLGLHHGFGAFAPVTRGLQIGGTQRTLSEPHLLRALHVGQGLLGRTPRGLGTRLFGTRSCGSRHALTNDRGLIVDALVAQPMQGVERVAEAHDSRV